jgi:hypothetical protein
VLHSLPISSFDVILSELLIATNKQITNMSRPNATNTSWPSQPRLRKSRVSSLLSYSQSRQDVNPWEQRTELRPVVRAHVCDSNVFFCKCKQLHWKAITGVTGFHGDAAVGAGFHRILRNTGKSGPTMTQPILDSSVVIATTLRAGWPKNRGLDSWHKKELFASPQRRARLWGPPSHLSNGYRGLFPPGKAARAWSWPLTSIQCRSQEYLDLYIHSPIRLHGILLS